MSTSGPAVEAVGTLVCWGPTIADDHVAVVPEPAAIGLIDTGRCWKAG